MRFLLLLLDLYFIVKILETSEKPKEDSKTLLANDRFLKKIINVISIRPPIIDWQC